jgi:hypothetical protein
MSTKLSILTAADSVQLEHVRQFIRNYAAWLGVDLSFQDFDQEMAALPGAYAPPAGGCSTPNATASRPAAWRSARSRQDCAS